MTKIKRIEDLNAPRRGYDISMLPKTEADWKKPISTSTLSYYDDVLAVVCGIGVVVLGALIAVAVGTQ